ncbi:MAG: hypothetical protein OEZ13_11995 [Spirochaetia bacterium]|nr:hypothetical protein [Spirochaetia bacterium]
MDTMDKPIRKDVKLYSIKDRKNKVSIKDFARWNDKNATIAEFVDSWPKILKTQELKILAEKTAEAIKNKKLVSVGMGAHVVKTGITPLIIEAISRGWIRHIALNGAGPIHDFELAYQGETSEDVASGLDDGTFGMIRETGDFFAEAFEKYKEMGYGYAAGRLIDEKNLKYKEHSLLKKAYEYKTPVTVHAAIGTDIIYQNPKIKGDEVGLASLRDFDKFANLLPELDKGGVFLNFGSAVIIPEVFLKALTVARNVTQKPYDFFTANFDMQKQYRTEYNILSRPVKKGNGFHFTGHHEIMLPLFFAMLCEKLE